MAPTSVSRRIKKSIEAFSDKDYEGSFVHLFPAIDKTAKKRRSKDGVGSRIKSFISDEEALISGVATNNVFKGINVDGVDFPTAIYKFGRTSIVHEGELDERLQINDGSGLQIGHVWSLPPSYLTGFIVAVVLAPENAGEGIEKELSIQLFGQTYQLNELWGKVEVIKQKMCELWQNDRLFD
ncbi:hypothetical protein [Vreelandella neptunia]|uniref:Uncharacterized protein n=1 Tax=Vreelandella neptunia TaxID=115551 RepID=A0ABS9S2U3_9GAMM|nr:hypothetical protein [Halomonas neptunia]MCH4810441.1 hypothetical protein [Halomonas neptunia]